MIPSPSRRPTRWWLPAILGVLLAPPLHADEAPVAVPAPAPASAAPPFDEFRPMVERPLFSSTRRPPVLADAQPESLDAKQLRDTWRLSGIVLDQDRQRLAIFSQRQGDRRLQLEAGMTLADEWRLKRIERDRVVLGNAVGEVELLLREPPAVSSEVPVGDDKTGKQPDKPAVKTTPAQGTPATAAPAPKG